MSRKFHGGQGAAVSATYDTECLPVGANLSGELRFMNITPGELGGLFTALGLLDLHILKVGAGKNLGFGRIQALPRAAGLHVRENQEPRAPTTAGRDFQDAFRQSPDRWEQGEAALMRLHSQPRW